jgi:hypothetical protein
MGGGGEGEGGLVTDSLGIGMCMRLKADMSHSARQTSLYEKLQGK